MKPTTLLFLLFCLTNTSSAWASELLSRHLSVSFQETPIKQALDEVARLADFEWAYNTKILDTGRRVTLLANDWTVREILRQILGPEYVFKSNGKYLILKKQAAPKSEISGVIRASKSGERLANVTIYDRKTLRATTTDSSGYYQLKVKKNAELVIVRLGYQDTILQVASMTPRYRNLELSPVPIPPADTANTLQKIQNTLASAATELDYFFAATLNKWHDLNVPDTLHRRFQISFLPNIGTNHVLSRKVSNDFSINMLAGQSAGVRYFEAAGLGNFTRKEVQGLQAAGLFNLNRGNCKGVQAAGLFNRTADTLEGAQFAGLINIARKSPKFSVQAAGLINIIQQNQDTPSAEKAPKCIQLAGLINTADEIDGLQASGLINKAHRVKGLQIGVFNTADEINGLQIGLLNRSGKRWLPILNWGHKKKVAQN